MVESWGYCHFLARIGKGEGTGSQLLVLSSQLEKDEERCLSRANFHRDAGDFGDDAGNRRFKVEFERFAEIGESFVFGFAVAGDVDLGALSDEEVVFFPGSCGEYLFHGRVLNG